MSQSLIGIHFPEAMEILKQWRDSAAKLLLIWNGSIMKAKAAGRITELSATEIRFTGEEHIFFTLPIPTAGFVHQQPTEEAGLVLIISLPSGEMYGFVEEPFGEEFTWPEEVGD